MPDQNPFPEQALGSDTFKEAVCVNASRIYDSCCDKDCLENLQVQFTDAAQPIINQALSVKSRGVELLNVLVDVDAIPFNRGFYTVDITYYFKVAVDVLSDACGQPVTVDGLCMTSKKVILFGSEGNVKTFTSDQSACELDDPPLTRASTPRASVQVVDPLCLGANLVDVRSGGDNCCCCSGGNAAASGSAPVAIPAGIARRFRGDFFRCEAAKTVEVTIGIFSIIQIERPVQLLIPAYDFCVPDKGSVDASTADNPCRLFDRVQFPFDEFFPPRYSDTGNEDPFPAGGCSCAQAKPDNE